MTRKSGPIGAEQYFELSGNLIASRRFCCSTVTRVASGLGQTQWKYKQVNCKFRDSIQQLLFILHCIWSLSEFVVHFRYLFGSVLLMQVNHTVLSKASDRPIPHVLRSHFVLGSGKHLPFFRTGYQGAIQSWRRPIPSHFLILHFDLIFRISEVRTPKLELPLGKWVMRHMYAFFLLTYSSRYRFKGLIINASLIRGGVIIVPLMSQRTLTHDPINY